MFTVRAKVWDEGYHTHKHTIMLEKIMDYFLRFTDKSAHTHTHTGVSPAPLSLHPSSTHRNTHIHSPSPKMHAHTPDPRKEVYIRR